MPAEYTPGPRRIVYAWPKGHPWEDRDWPLVNTGDGNEVKAPLVVAEPGKDYIPVAYCVSGDGRAEADAKLIAAATEMVETLETTLSNIRSLRAANIPYDGTYEKWEATVEAALRKAGAL